MDANTPDAVFNAQRDAYIEILKPAFLPDAPFRDDVLRYFASLFRVLGIEDKGWDPYGESKGTLNDLNRLMKLSLPDDKFPDADATVWRLGLLLYCHIVEMDAPYEVLTNLLRYRLGKGYSPSPFFLFLTEKEKKGVAKRGISTVRKIEIIKNLSQEAGLSIGGIFDEFYRSELRNAVQHSDFILAEDKFRCRGGISGHRAFAYTYEDLDVLLTKAKAYVAAYFQIESIARQVWGLQVNRAVAYDPLNKGLIEILADDRGLMCGFAVHWPNGSMSQYKRGANGVDMLNCMLDMKGAGLSLFVGSYARSPGKFSPLVENDAKPNYQPLSDGRVPEWPGDDFAW
ncbi:MAG: hypothetical protein ABL871_07215 [Terricaulis sp.]